MAGKGPAPKRPEERRRRNQESLEQLPAEGYEGEYPALPASYTVRWWDGEAHRTKRQAFLATTKEWYAAWATSPMAVEFTAVHFLRLQSVAKLQDRFDRGDMTVAAELRQALAGFGGTPYDVRRLGREISQSSGSASRPAAPKRARSDRRARLEVVK